MHGVIEAVIKHPRTTISVLVMLVFAGIFARSSITVEADPDITIPLVMVTIPHIGISPEDADRLIVRPVESEVRSLEGIEEVNAYAREGLATIALQFDVDFDLVVTFYARKRRLNALESYKAGLLLGRS